FNSDNYFYGGQIGMRGEVRFNRMFLNGSAAIALGDTHQVAGIGGATALTITGGTPFSIARGLLATPTNIRHLTRDVFGVVPEVRYNVGYQLTHRARVFMGYTMIPWNRVVRAGDEIDPVVNPAFVPFAQNQPSPTTAVRPAFAFHDRTFWAQGLNFGLELRF